jgi:hypothetical protein
MLITIRAQYYVNNHLQELIRVKKKIAQCSLVLMCIGFIVGLLLIFTAPSRGIDEGNRFVMRMGGFVDTNQFEQVIQGTIRSHQIGGFVLSFVGGFGVILSGYALYKEM